MTMYIVGKKYKLPTVVFRIQNRLYRFVSLHQHVGDISGSPHTHFDVRFISDRILRVIGKEDGVYAPITGGSLIGGAMQETQMKWMRCYRAYEPLTNWPFSPDDSLFQKLENKLVNQDNRLNLDCRVCPHQGCDLKDLPSTDIAGVDAVVCPCHGMAWSTTDGSIVRRFTK